MHKSWRSWSPEGHFFVVSFDDGKLREMLHVSGEHGLRRAAV